MTFEVDLKNLKRLHRDSEKQLLEFNEIVPYEHNPANVYSPKLVNLLLTVGPQIENLTDLIIIQLQLSPEGNGLSSRIKELDKDGVLSSFEITSMPQNTQFHPFTEDFSWWEIYNKTKHDLSRSQFEITYLSVINSLAVLASLHRLANIVLHCNYDYKQLVL